MASLLQIMPAMAPLRKLAVALIVASLSHSCTTVRNEKDGTITIEDEPQTIILAADPHSALVYDIHCDSDWEVSLSYSWMVATPMSCHPTAPGDSRRLYLTAFQNSRETERKGTITIQSSSDRVSIPVIQLPAGYTGGISSSLQSGDGIFPSAGGMDKLVLFCDKEWVISHPEWLTVSKVSGEALSTQTLTLTTGENQTESELTGELVIISGQERKVIPVSQAFKAKQSTVASWTVGDNDFLVSWNSSHGNCWTSMGILPADSPDGSQAKASWHVSGESSEARTYIISSDLAGHLAVKPTWSGDYMLFEIPGADVSEGERLHLKAAIQSNVSGVPADWVLEHLENGLWVSDLELKITKTGVPVAIENIFTVSSGMTEQGFLSLRVRCNGTKSIGGSNLTSPQSSSAIRFVPFPDESGKINSISLTRAE